MLQAERRDGCHRHALLVDEKRVLVRAVRRAPVLHDAKSPRRDPCADPVFQEDDTVGDVFFQPLAGESSLSALAGNDRGDALVFEPAEEPPQLRPNDGLVRKRREKGFDRVQHDTTRSDRIDGITEPNEQTLEVVLAGFLDLGTLNTDVIHHQLLLLDERREVEPER